LVTAAKVKYDVELGPGKLSFETPEVHRLVGLLEDGPKPFGELLAGQPLRKAFDLVLALLVRDQAMPVSAEASVDASARLNSAIQKRVFPHLNMNAVKTAGTGSTLSQPHFPHLKLPAAAQYAAARYGSIPIGALVVLEPTGRDGLIQVDALPRLQALRRLCEQTVAIGLFDPWLHQRQLAFVSRLLAEVPAMCLRYPHDHGRLAEVCATLSERIARHP
jgi:hypothetical protein